MFLKMGFTHPDIATLIGRVNYAPYNSNVALSPFALKTQTHFKHSL